MITGDWSYARNHRAAFDLILEACDAGATPGVHRYVIDGLKLFHIDLTIEAHDYFPVGSLHPNPASHRQWLSILVMQHYYRCPHRADLELDADA